METFLALIGALVIVVWLARASGLKRVRIDIEFGRNEKPQAQLIESEGQ